MVTAFDEAPFDGAAFFDEAGFGVGSIPPPVPVLCGPGFSILLMRLGA